MIHGWLEPSRKGSCHEKRRDSALTEARLMEPDDATLETAADAALRLLFSERPFLEDWEERIYSRLEERDRLHDRRRLKGSPKCEKVEVSNPITYNAVRELLHSVETTTKAFMSQVDYAFCHNEPEANRDSGILFEAGLRVERAVTEYEAPVLAAQVGIASRRLSNVFRLFSTRISQRFQLDGAYATATRVCDLSYTVAKQLERYIKMAMPNSSQMQNLLRVFLESIDAFNVIVVEKLHDMTLKYGRRHSKSPVQKFSPTDRFGSPSSRAIRIANAVAAVCPPPVPRSSINRVAVPSRPVNIFVASNRGFLLDPALSKARSRLAIAASKFPTTRSKSAGMRLNRKMAVSIDNTNGKKEKEPLDVSIDKMKILSLEKPDKSETVYSRARKMLERHDWQGTKELGDAKNSDVSSEDDLYKTAQAMSRIIINDMRKMAGEKAFVSKLD
ncbi:unnamed protein product [Caenorhabditis auriculariae]|uniref:Uncharacterized protein n=1 Tax=Caenorhabditis auriculariae TaxID=2777116 RepID=A0A8S1GYC1_9PELO|nr:unnamed protein product [Caenorhabditis auriculariae]